MIDSPDREHIIDILTQAFSVGELGDCIRLNCSLPNCGPWCDPIGDDALPRLFRLLLDYGSDGRTMWLAWQNDLRAPAQGEPLERSAPSPRQQFVYFIRAGTKVKIGISVDPHNRLCQLQTGNDEKLELLGCIPGDRKTEKAVQAMFSCSAIDGEWFRLTPAIKDWIEGECSDAEALDKAAPQDTT